MDDRELRTESIQSCRGAYRAALVLAAALILVAITAEAPKAPRDALVNLVYLKDTVAIVCSKDKVFALSEDGTFPEKSGYIISFDGTPDSRLTSESLSDCSVKKLNGLLDSQVLHGRVETRGEADASYYDDEFPEDYDWESAEEVIGLQYGKSDMTVWTFLNERHPCNFDRGAFRADCLAFEFNEYDTIDSIIDTLTRKVREAVPTVKLAGFDVSTTALFIVAPVFVVLAMCYFLAQLAHVVTTCSNDTDLVAKFPWILGTNAPYVVYFAYPSVWLPVIALASLMFRLWWTESVAERTAFVVLLLIGVGQCIVATLLVREVRRIKPATNAP